PTAVDDHLVEAGRRGDQPPAALHDHGSAASSDLERSEKMRELLERDVDADHTGATADVAIAHRGGQARLLIGEEDIHTGPEEIVGGEGTLVPGPRPRIVVVAGIVFPADLLAGGVVVNPSDAPRARRVGDDLRVDAACRAPAYQDIVPVLVGETEVGDLRN